MTKKLRNLIWKKKFPQQKHERRLIGRKQKDSQEVNILKWNFSQNPEKKFSQASKTHTSKESSKDVSNDDNTNVVNKSGISHNANVTQNSYEKRNVQGMNHVQKNVQMIMVLNMIKWNQKNHFLSNRQRHFS